MKEKIFGYLDSFTNSVGVVTFNRVPHEIEVILETAGLDYDENVIELSGRERYYVFSFIDKDGSLQTIDFILRF